MLTALSLRDRPAAARGATASLALAMVSVLAGCGGKIEGYPESSEEECLTLSIVSACQSPLCRPLIVSSCSGAAGKTSCALASDRIACNPVAATSRVCPIGLYCKRLPTNPGAGREDDGAVSEQGVCWSSPGSGSSAAPTSP